MENRPTTASRTDWAALICSLVLLVWLVSGLAACGTEDLTFPGDFPATATDNPDATSTPTDEQ